MQNNIRLNIKQLVYPSLIYDSCAKDSAVKQSLDQ